MSKDLLSDRGFRNAHTRIFIRPPTLTGHSFAALGAMMMKSSSFESPKRYLLILNSKNSIAALLAPIRTCWKVPICYINRVLVNLIWAALYIAFSFMKICCFLMILRSSSFPQPFNLNHASFETTFVFTMYNAAKWIEAKKNQVQPTRACHCHTVDQ